MSIKASIDIEFFRSVEPKKILLSLIDSGWELGFQGEVLFLNSFDCDGYDWQVKSLEEFDLDAFIGSHSPYGRIGVSMVFEGVCGGEFLISEDWLSFLISINKVFISRDVPDFSFYLERLSGVIKNFDASVVKCECIF